MRHELHQGCNCVRTGLREREAYGANLRRGQCEASGNENLPSLTLDGRHRLWVPHFHESRPCAVP